MMSLSCHLFGKDTSATPMSLQLVALFFVHVQHLFPVFTVLLSVNVSIYHVSPKM